MKLLFENWRKYLTEDFPDPNDPRMLPYKLPERFNPDNKRKFYEKPSVVRNRRNRLRKRIIEKENQTRKEEENNFYKPKSKRRRSRRCVTIIFI